jgi:hypothetical protein
VSGRDTAPPLILLPGVRFGSLMWMGMIEALSARHRTCALDIIGRARPCSGSPFPSSPASCSSRLALTIEGSSWGIWILELERGTFTRLTLEHDNRDPHWTPDGQGVVCGSFRNGRYGIYEKAADGGGPEEQLVTSQYSRGPESWSPDGREMTFGQWNPETEFDLWVLPRDDDASGEPRPLVATRFAEGGSALSPDGNLHLSGASSTTSASATGSLDLPHTHSPPSPTSPEGRLRTGMQREARGELSARGSPDDPQAPSSGHSTGSRVAPTLNRSAIRLPSPPPRRARGGHAN